MFCHGLKLDSVLAEIVDKSSNNQFLTKHRDLRGSKITIVYVSGYDERKGIRTDIARYTNKFNVMSV